MASVTYDKCILIASVTYGKGIMASVIMAKVLWQMKLSPAMDLSKAFGLVSRNKLSPELIDKGICPLLLQCLISIYSNMYCDMWVHQILIVFK